MMKTKPKSPAKPGRRSPAKSANARKIVEHATQSREAMQRASSVHKKRKGSAVPRSELRGVVVYLSPEAKEKLVGLAHDQRKSVQAMGLEAFNLLFESYLEKPIA